jgi:type VI secretion system protein ImpL
MSSLPQLIATHLLLALAVLAACCGLIAGWLIIRARRPPAAAADRRNDEPKNPFWRALRARLDRIRARFDELLHQLRMRREWRYQAPWILVCGEAGVGKTRLVDSIRHARRDEIGRRERRLAIEGTHWMFFDHGVVIDVDGASLPDPHTDNRKWNDVLGQLLDRRPERALDGVVLALSASTLLRGTQADVQRLAQYCHAQLADLQERCEFLFPVYVVITQCDAIEGFAEFWNAQPEACRAEIFGWSNPSALDTSYVPQWMDDAFDYLGGVLKQLLLQAAAADRTIEKPDEFFLLPQRFQGLRAPVTEVLADLFRVSAYRAAPFFRGVYFVGRMPGAVAQAELPSERVAFVDQLFTDKIFAEPNLARPLRQALWSRHVLTRRLQIGAVVLGVLLYLSLVNAGVKLRQQVDVGVQSVTLIHHPEELDVRGADCAAKATVYDLLSNISRLDVDLTFVTIPASWIDRRVEIGGVHLVANQAFEDVIFPAMACRLERRARRISAGEVLAADDADTLTDDRKRLQQYLDEVLAFEENRVRFREIVAKASGDESGALLTKLDLILQYLYGDPLPAAVRRSGGYHRQALAQTEFHGTLQIQQDFRENVIRHVTELAVAARAEISDQIEEGAAALAALENDRPPLLRSALRFDHWLQQMRSEWMTSGAGADPCTVVGAALRPRLGKLTGPYRYSSDLVKVADNFDSTHCYEPAQQILAKLDFAPNGVLFTREGDHWNFAPAVENEAKGMAAVASLDFMQLPGAQPFRCEPPVRGWRGANLEQAARFIREYRAFADARHLDDSQSALPVYARVARRQLQSVLDQNMALAQISASAAAADPVGVVESLASSEEALMRQSTELSRLYPSLVWVLAQYQQFGFDSAGRVTQCVRRFGADALQRLSRLGDASGVYDVQAAATDGEAGPLFTLGAAPEVKDYLAAQFERAQVLASYAGPFVALMRNTQGNGAPAMPPGTSPVFWENTRQEVNRVLQFKDTTAQAALLNEFILKNLAPMTTDTCSDLLSAYTPASYGNDLFSQRREGLERRAQWYCGDQSRAVSVSHYQRWARRFGSELAGRFPFAAVEASEDASLSATRSFFADYDVEHGTLRKELSWLKRNGVADVTQFLNGLDAAAQLFAASAASGDGPAPLRMKLEFRALPAQSAGPENIVSWRLQTEDAAASYPNGPTDIEWRFGQQLSFVARWAALSPVVPQADPQQADMRVAGNTVTFEAQGAWALFKLLLRHAPTAGVRQERLGAGVALLEFRVPTLDRQHPETVSQSRFYVAVRLFGIDAKTQAPVPVRWPGAFPAYAPSVW